jgi:hypothetical protein
MLNHSILLTGHRGLRLSVLTAFEVFKGDSQTERLGTSEVVAKCFACHGEKKEQDYVFTTYRK